MEDVWLAEFAVKAVFHQEVYSDEFMVFSLQVIKGFNKESAVTVVL